MTSLASETQSIADGMTVVGGIHKTADADLPRYSKPLATAADNSDEMGPFFVKIGSDGVIGALQKLDAQLRKAGKMNIISKKSPTTWSGEKVQPGMLGLIDHGGQPKVVTRPGRYPGAPFRNWWARKWCGTERLSDSVIEFQGLTILQVSRNQTAVVCDPQHRIFIVKNAGFVALNVEGSYDVLAVVDPTSLPVPIRDRLGATLGAKHEVYSYPGTWDAPTVVALFLDIPAHNCAILQRGTELELIQAGQHCITSPNVTLRGMYTYSESQFEMPPREFMTRDQVTLRLTIYLKWKLSDPLKLAAHGYNSPYDALTEDKAHAILTQIVAHIDYGVMMKQRFLAAESAGTSYDPSETFIDIVRARAFTETREVALEYGIILKDLAVIDFKFRGDVAYETERLMTSRIRAQIRNSEADADAYEQVATAMATNQGLQMHARTRAEATRLAAGAEADAISFKAAADAGVKDNFARETAMERIKRQPVQNPDDGAGSSLASGAGDAMLFGMAAGSAWEARRASRKLPRPPSIIRRPSVESIPDWTPYHSESEDSLIIPAYRQAY